MSHSKAYSESSERVGTRRLLEQRELVDPSTVWREAAFFFLALALTLVIGGLSLSPDAAVHSSVFWISVPWSLLMAAFCGLAHIDVNRGRRMRRYVLKARND
jgi:hypothetical protein